MQIRKYVGNRPLSEEALKATGKIPKSQLPDYLVAHACFNRRKSFKYPVEDNGSVLLSKSCPQCAAGIFLMGRSFESPKKPNKEPMVKSRKITALRFHVSYKLL